MRVVPIVLEGLGSTLKSIAKRVEKLEIRERIETDNVMIANSLNDKEGVGVLRLFSVNKQMLVMW